MNAVLPFLLHESRVFRQFFRSRRFASFFPQFQVAALIANFTGDGVTRVQKSFFTQITELLVPLMNFFRPFNLDGFELRGDLGVDLAFVTENASYVDRPLVLYDGRFMSSVTRVLPTDEHPIVRCLDAVPLGLHLFEADCLPNLSRPFKFFDALARGVGSVLPIRGPTSC